MSRLVNNSCIYDAFLWMIRRKQPLRLVHLYFSFIICFDSSDAQILNVDREKGQDTITQKVSVVGNVGLSMDRQQVYLTQGTAGLEVAFRNKRKHLLLVKAEGSALFADDRPLEENGYATLRFRDQDSRTAYPDLYVQYQWNTVLGLRHRWVAGGNCRVKVYDNEIFDLFGSVGVFYENEIWDPTISQFTFGDSILQLGRQQRILARLNTYLKTGINISKTTDFVFINYVQFPVSGEFTKPRWHIQASLLTSITKRIEIYFRYSHVYDLFRVLPINTFFFATDVGIQISY